MHCKHRHIKIAKMHCGTYRKLQRVNVEVEVDITFFLRFFMLFFIFF